MDQPRVLVDIFDAETLGQCEPFVYDANFALDDIDWDVDARRFRLGSWTPAWDMARYEHLFLFLYKKTIPMREQVLEFQNVLDVSVNPPDAVRDEVGWIGWKDPPGEIEIVGHCKTLITIRVAGLRGELRETHETRDDWAWHRLTFGAIV
jgi:hypothetical protein